MSVSLSKQLKQLSQSDGVVLNFPMHQDEFEKAQKSRDPLILKQFQSQVDSVIIEALKKCPVFEKTISSQKMEKDACEEALNTIRFLIPVYKTNGDKTLISVPQPRFDWSEKEWQAISRARSGYAVAMKKLMEMYRANLIGALSGRVTVRSDFAWDDLSNLAFQTQRSIASTSETTSKEISSKPVPSFRWQDLSKLSESCVGLRHVSSALVAFREANITGLQAGSALNISPQMHLCFQTSSDKDYYEQFLEVRKKENPEFLAQFQEGVLSFVQRSVMMEIEGGVIHGITKKSIFKKVLENCQFSLINFGYTIQDDHDRPKVMSPTELAGYGQGLGQYHRKYLEPGAAFTQVASLEASHLDLSKEEWETPIKSNAEFALLKNHICGLYFSNILDAVHKMKIAKKA